MPRANRRLLLAAGAIGIAAFVAYFASVQVAIIVLLILLGIILLA